MSHFSHTLDGVNMDLQGPYKNRDAWLELAGDWKDPNPAPVIEEHDGVFVVRDDLIPGGTKVRWGDLLVRNVKEDHLVYVAPRHGFAAIALTYLAKQHSKKLTLFCPASKSISVHQARAKELGAELKFLRIAAMPILNQAAKRWAEEKGHFFIPFGLKHPLVTAAGVKTAYDLSVSFAEPEHAWTVISTGVLTRALQIGWPNANFHAVAVARNIHEGEAGRAEVFSEPLPFAKDATSPVPFNSAKNYDAKAWNWIMRNPHENALFWNVAGEISETDSITQIIKETDSQRDWGQKEL